MKYLLPLLLIGCTPISTIPERCVAVAEAVAAKTPAGGGPEYMLAWRQNYERAFEECAK
jgi:hypothetical protein